MKSLLNAQLLQCVLTKLRLILPFLMPSFMLMDINFHLSIEIEIKRVGGEIVFVREGIIAKRMKGLEGKTSEIICIELTFLRKSG